MPRKLTPANSQPGPTEILRQQVLFCVGKGGVGKTTTACAAAITLLDRARTDDRIYLVSTDPAHSLGDSLGKPIGHHPHLVARNRSARLYACEVDPAPALKDFKDRYGGVISEILERGTFLSTGEIGEFLGLTLPGMDEVMALFHLSDILEGGAYRHIVVDTAPAGHTMRLLELPEVFSNWLAALEALEEKHRFMVTQLAGRHRPDRVTEALNDFSRRIQAVKSMIQDPSRSAFVMVTSPEPIIQQETIRYFQFLVRRRIPVAALVINRVQPAIKNCEYCRARASSQAPVIKDLKRRFASLRLALVPVFPGEVRGLRLLRTFSQFAWRDSGRVLSVPAVNERTRPSGKAKRLNQSPHKFELHPRRVLIFGGKGGVGKTTAASAAAIAIAERFPDLAVVVLSTDPAHSLSDTFGEQVGELRTGLAGIANLDGMEIDSAARFQAFRNRYESWVDELFGSLTAGSRWRIEFDLDATKKLLTIAPPGIDEMFSLATIASLLVDRTYRAIVVDTAPSGHLLRLLELPETALSWLRALFKLMLKYREVIHWGQLAGELVSLSRSIKSTLSLLRDSSKTEFVGVAAPEKMSLDETVKLHEQLVRLNIPVNRLLVNNLIPLDDGRACGFCSARRQEQDQVLRSYRARLPELRIFVAPEQGRPVRGTDRLRFHFSGWAALNHI